MIFLLGKGLTGAGSRRSTIFPEGKMIYVLPTACAADYLLKSPQAQSGGGPASTVEGAETDPEWVGQGFGNHMGRKTAHKERGQQCRPGS